MVHSLTGLRVFLCVCLRISVLACVPACVRDCEHVFDVNQDITEISNVRCVFHSGDRVILRVIEWEAICFSSRISAAVNHKIHSFFTCL